MNCYLKVYIASGLLMCYLNFNPPTLYAFIRSYSQIYLMSCSIDWLFKLCYIQWSWRFFLEYNSTDGCCLGTMSYLTLNPVHFYSASWTTLHHWLAVFHILDRKNLLSWFPRLYSEIPVGRHLRRRLCWVFRILDFVWS